MTNTQSTNRNDEILAALRELHQESMELFERMDRRIRALEMRAEGAKP